jgi:WD40 repeat protein
VALVGLLATATAAGAWWYFTHVPTLAKRLSLGESGDELSITAFSPDGRLITSGPYQRRLRVDDGSADRPIRIWDARTGRVVASLPGGSRFAPLRFAPDGRHVLAGSWSGPVGSRWIKSLRVWDATTGRQVARRDLPNQVAMLAFTADGAEVRFARNNDGRVEVQGWDARTLDDRSLHVFRPTPDTVQAAVPSGYGRMEPPAPINPRFYQLALSEDGRRLATGSGDGRIQLWDIASGRVLSEVRGIETQIRSLAFDPAGRRLACGQYKLGTWEEFERPGVVRVWNVDSGRLIADLESHAWEVVFSPDGRLMAGAGTRAGRTWLRGLPDRVQTLARNRAGIDVVQRHELMIWGTDRWRLAYLLTDDKSAFHRPAFSPDGTTLATTDNGGTLTLWDVPGR